MPPADNHRDALPQPAQGTIDRRSLGAVSRIQHAPHLALGHVEVAGKTALRNPGLAPRLVKGRLQRNLHRRNDQRPPLARARRLGQVLALPDRGRDQLAQQIPGFRQRLFPGRAVRCAPPEVGKRHHVPAVVVTFDPGGIIIGIGHSSTPPGPGHCRHSVPRNSSPSIPRSASTLLNSPLPISLLRSLTVVLRSPACKSVPCDKTCSPPSVRCATTKRTCKFRLLAHLVRTLAMNCRPFMFATV